MPSKHVLRRPRVRLAAGLLLLGLLGPALPEKIALAQGGRAVPVESSIQSGPKVGALRVRLQQATHVEAVRQILEETERVLRRVAKGEDNVALQLLRLDALNKALQITPFEQHQTPTYKALVARYRRELVYSEPADQYMTRFEVYWNLYEAHRSHPLAETLAWAGATQTLAGETEGDAECMLAVLDLTYVRYLRAYPRGPHAGQALDAVQAILKPLVEDPAGKVFRFPPRSEPGSRYRSMLGAFQTTVRATSGTRSDEVLALLRILQQRAR